jgi:hypothetical protein
MRVAVRRLSEGDDCHEGASCSVERSPKEPQMTVNPSWLVQSKRRRWRSALATALCVVAAICLTVTPASAATDQDDIARSSSNSASSCADPMCSMSRDPAAMQCTICTAEGYVAHLAACPDGMPITAEFVIDAYHRLFRVEQSFPMSKHDLQARPIYHHQCDSIEARLTIVFAALAVSRWIEHTTAWSTRKFDQITPQLPHDRDPSRRPHHQRRRPDTRRPRQRPQRHQGKRACAPT